MEDLDIERRIKKLGGKAYWSYLLKF